MMINVVGVTEKREVGFYFAWLAGGGRSQAGNDNDVIKDLMGHLMFGPEILYICTFSVIIIKIS